MALVIDLKPGEKILVGDAVIKNDDSRTRLHISGDSPIMREKDILQEQDADSPCKKIYFLVQCMYLDNDPKQYHEPYFKHIKEIQTASASTTPFFLEINGHIMGDNYYRALKSAKKLIKHEKELIDDVLRNANAPAK